MFTINTKEIAESIKKLFGIKRFANIEFTARQAFENLDIAMVFLQIFLIFATITLIISSFFWIRSYKRKKKFLAMQILLHQLMSEVYVLEHDKQLSDKQSLAIELGRKEAIFRIKQLLQKKPFAAFIDQYHYEMLLLNLESITKKELTPHDQIQIIQHCISLFHAITTLKI